VPRQNAINCGHGAGRGADTSTAQPPAFAPAEGMPGVRGGRQMGAPRRPQDTHVCTVGEQGAAGVWG